jgi:hypothetical protein
MKVFSVSTYVTTVIHLEYNNESYEITHREDSNTGLVQGWDIINEDGDEEVDVKVRIAIIEHCKKYLS